ncbi:hypothetical protein [Chryseobacterium fistulae]|uniref:Uncharacterized protein n=1 Tax=Chryseobacterium fistulae TaxID=2675058 RepID=A0A6N4XRM9_9FLAO|nr:hypothetical protein [Chryseobacterium fistulae]CAA7386070.1 hypothetical protein CHRY9393_00360 [Chryseobacterium fistulae]
MSPIGGEAPLGQASGGKGLLKIVKSIHGNSLKSLRPTWGYKLYDAAGNFLKNGITSKKIPEARYTQKFMKDKYMV